MLLPTVNQSVTESLFNTYHLLTYTDERK